MHAKAEPTVSFELTPSEPGAIDPPVHGDDVVLGLCDPSYAAAVREAVSASHTGMVVTAAACGTHGSSDLIFYRLATVLTRFLGTDWVGIGEHVIWSTWEAAQPGGTTR